MTKDEMKTILAKANIETSLTLDSIILDGANIYLENQAHREELYKAPNDLLSAFYVLLYANLAYPKFRVLERIRKRVEDKLAANDWRYLEGHTRDIVARLEYKRRAERVGKSG